MNLIFLVKKFASDGSINNRERKLFWGLVFGGIHPSGQRPHETTLPPETPSPRRTNPQANNPRREAKRSDKTEFSRGVEKS